jgi:hypothetical protein
MKKRLPYRARTAPKEAATAGAKHPAVGTAAFQPLPPIFETVWRRRIEDLRSLDYSDAEIEAGIRLGELSRIVVRRINESRSSVQAHNSSIPKSQAKRREIRGANRSIDILRDVLRGEKLWKSGEYTAAVEAIIGIVALEGGQHYQDIEIRSKVSGNKKGKATTRARVLNFMAFAQQEVSALRKKLGREPAPKEIHGATEAVILARGEGTIADKTFYKHWAKVD